MMVGVDMKKFTFTKPRPLTLTEIVTRRRALEFLVWLVGSQEVLAQILGTNRDRIRNLINGFGLLHVEEAAQLVKLSREKITMAQLVPNFLDSIAYIQGCNNAFPTSTTLNFLELSDVDQAIDPALIAMHKQRLLEGKEFEVVIINQDYKVIANAALYRAYQELEYKEIPVCYVHVPQLLDHNLEMLAHVGSWTDYEKYTLGEGIRAKLIAKRRQKRHESRPKWATLGDENNANPTQSRTKSKQNHIETELASLVGIPSRQTYQRLGIVKRHGIDPLKVWLIEGQIKIAKAALIASKSMDEQTECCAKHMAKLNIDVTTSMQVGVNAQYKT